MFGTATVASYKFCERFSWMASLQCLSEIPLQTLIRNVAWVISYVTWPRDPRCSCELQLSELRAAAVDAELRDGGSCGPAGGSPGHLDGGGTRWSGPAGASAAAGSSRPPWAGRRAATWRLTERGAAPVTGHGTEHTPTRCTTDGTRRRHAELTENTLLG